MKKIWKIFLYIILSLFVAFLAFSLIDYLVLHNRVENAQIIENISKALLLFVGISLIVWIVFLNINSAIKDKKREEIKNKNKKGKNK